MKESYVYEWPLDRNSPNWDDVSRIFSAPLRPYIVSWHPKAMPGRISPIVARRSLGEATGSNDASFLFDDGSNNWFQSSPSGVAAVLDLARFWGNSTIFFSDVRDFRIDTDRIREIGPSNEISAVREFLSMTPACGRIWIWEGNLMQIFFRDTSALHADLKIDVL